MVHPTRVKAPLTIRQCTKILTGLVAKVAAPKTTDIACTLAYCNVFIIILGFFALLRRSEIVRVLLEHFQLCGTGLKLLVPTSKTD